MWLSCVCSIPIFHTVVPFRIISISTFFGGRVGDVVCYDFAQNAALGVWIWVSGT